MKIKATDKELMEFYNYKRQGILDIKRDRQNVYFALKFFYLSEKYNLLDLINNALDSFTAIKRECINENVEKIEYLLLKIKDVIQNIKKVNDVNLIHFYNYKEWTFARIKEREKTYKALIIYYLLNDEKIFDKFKNLINDEIFDLILSECTPNGEKKFKKILEILRQIKELFVEAKKTKTNKKSRKSKEN